MLADRDGESWDESAEDVEEKTRDLMGKAMSESQTTSDKESAKQRYSSDDIADATDASAPDRVGETFERIQIRMEDILGSVEDAAQSVEPGIDEKVSEVISTTSKRLKGAGLGVFATRAVSIVRQELQEGLSGSATMEPVYRSIGEGKSEVRDIITKASRGAIRAINRTTGQLQSKLFKMYTRVQELETSAEDLRSQVREWRSRANELEDLIQSKEQSLSRLEFRISQMQEDHHELEATLDEKDEEISALRGQLSEARSQIEQKEELIASLDAAEELVDDYEKRTKELSSVKGQLTEMEEKVSQKEERITTLEEGLHELRDDNAALKETIDELSDDLASVRGTAKSRKSEIESLEEQLQELRARWEMLYQVAEEEPDFKAYFLIADKEHTWLPLTHLSKALGIPTVRLRRDLQRFVDVGLIELEGDKVRPRKLSDVAEEVAGAEDRIFQKARESILGSATDEETEDDFVSEEQTESEDETKNEDGTATEESEEDTNEDSEKS